MRAGVPARTGEDGRSLAARDGAETSMLLAAVHESASWVRAELDDRMRLNNGSIVASYDTARIFAGLGFGSSTASVDHLAPSPHRLWLRQHAGVGLCSGSIPHFTRRQHRSKWGTMSVFQREADVDQALTSRLLLILAA